MALAVVWIVSTVTVSRHVRTATRNSDVIEDFQWTYQLLLHEKEPGRLREFLKARLYNLGMVMPPEKLRLFPTVDFGPVNETLLGSCLAAPPHADSPNEHRQIMLERLKQRSPNHGLESTSAPPAAGTLETHP